MKPKRVTSGNVMLFQGLSLAQVESSRAENGINVLTPPARKPWWRELLGKFNDPIIRILMVAAAIAIAVGAVDGSYIEGIGIVCAILLATFLAFLNEHRAAREFDLLNQTSDDVPIKVVREGIITTVPRRELVVGDIVLLDMGEEVPADGELLEAVALQVNESRLTGESEPAHKAPGPVPPDSDHAAYPPNRLLRGTTVADGHGVMRLTAVGDHTEIGHTARAAAEEHDSETPLSHQLARLSQLIGVVAFGAAAFLFGTLVVRSGVTGEVTLDGAQTAVLAILGLACVIAIIPVWLPILFDARELLGRGVERPAWLSSGSMRLWGISIGAGALVLGIGLLVVWLSGLTSVHPLSVLPAEVGREYLRYFMVAVTVIVVAIPEGLAMSVTLSLAYSMRRMTATHNLVRRMHACETIGATTVICSDKTGTLTLNEMRVSDLDFPGIDLSSLSGSAHRLGTNEHLVAEALSVNSTANLSRPKGEPPSALGVPTEGALLLWLDERGVDYLALREPFEVTAQLTFSPVRKFMATLGQSGRQKPHPVLHVKGAPEVVIERCARSLGPEGEAPLEDTGRREIVDRLSEYQSRGMRVLGFAYRSVKEEDLALAAQEPNRTGALGEQREHSPKEGGDQTRGVDNSGDNDLADRRGPDTSQPDLEALAESLIWLGFAAIIDPVRPDVADALKICRGAGIDVKMVTGDNSLTASEIGRQIGLLSGVDPARAHLTGPELVALPEGEAMERLADLRIVSRARPTDKLRLVELLRKRGAVVAVTGDGTNDGPALNLAHVGLAMGKSGTAVAKEASDIILLDDSFTSIANAVLWGRSLYQNIQRFVVFQLTINVTALLTVLFGPFIGVKLPLTVTQMLWVNLIMDTFAALALAAEPPHQSVMQRPPRDPKQFILTRAMAANVLGVGLVFFATLISLLVVLNRGGITPYEMTLFFTTFVLMQLWNLFNARALGRTHSAFSKILQNRGFLLVVAAIGVGQILIVQYGGALFRTVPLSLRDWLIVAAATSIVLWVGEAIRAVRRLRVA